jgi:hypothetical protein
LTYLGRIYPLGFVMLSSTWRPSTVRALCILKIKSSLQGIPNFEPKREQRVPKHNCGKGYSKCPIYPKLTGHHVVRIWIFESKSPCAKQCLQKVISLWVSFCVEKILGGTLSYRHKGPREQGHSNKSYYFHCRAIFFGLESYFPRIFCHGVI